MDIWGYCPQCTRWFYLEDETGRCPVCQSDPERVERRSEPTTTGGQTTTAGD